MKRVLSLGAGVQSSTVLLMSERGLLPRLDCAIFGDTQWEPEEVYEHLEWLKSACTIPIHTVTAGNLRKDAIDFRLNRRSDAGKRFASMPTFVKNPDGTQGIVRRQCTREYKINPVERFIKREILGLRPGQRSPKEVVVQHWFGISADELYRMRKSQNRWEVNHYPLIKDLAIKKPGLLFEQGYTRSDCVRWLKENYPDRNVPRSACIGCPFHTDDEWLAIKSRPAEWKDAVEFDHLIRSAERQNQNQNRLLAGDLYLHRSLIPLDMVDLVPGKNSDGMGNECHAVCGV